MAGVKNIYIRKGDEPFWNWAQEEADRSGVALSSWLSRLLQERKYAVGSKQMVQETPIELLHATRDKVIAAISMLEAEAKGEVNES